jgi:hypothetical protein
MSQRATLAPLLEKNEKTQRYSQSDLGNFDFGCLTGDAIFERRVK